MQSPDLSQPTESVRRFNRFYTRQIGLLQEHLSKSPFSLTEARILYELAQVEETTATDLGRQLDLDPGYLSRILTAFQKRGLLEKRPSATDGRQTFLRLTPGGRQTFVELNQSSHSEIEALLARLTPEDQTRLVSAMQTIENLLQPAPQAKAPYVIRPPRPGDMGWVVHRHAVLYTREYHWNEQFEALVAEIVAKFVQEFDPRKEACWIAEKDGEIVGSIFLVKKSDEVAKLRLLYTEPKARGLGIGSRLVDECIQFARQAGYRRITLWTNSVLTAARHIYEKTGFRMLLAEPHHSFGHDLVGETWELDLE